MPPWLWFVVGYLCGATVLWWHFATNRLIRTRHEWYRDPLIASRYPEEARRALDGPDGW